MKSYHQDEVSAPTGTGSGNAPSSVNKKYMRTGAEVCASEFSEYHFYGKRAPEEEEEQDAGEEEEEYCEELVVCSKEVRALLSYCESTETPHFHLYFTCGGRPVKLSSESRVDVKVELILATLETRRQAIRQHEQANRQPTPAPAPAPKTAPRQQKQQSSSRQQPPPQQRQRQHQQIEERGRDETKSAPVLTDESETVVMTVDARKKKKRLMADSDDDN